MHCDLETSLNFFVVSIEEYVYDFYYLTITKNYFNFYNSCEQDKLEKYDIRIIINILTYILAESRGDGCIEIS